VVTSLGLLTCSATLVHLSGGVIEMHFHYFVMVGVITLYQDWWPFLIAIALRRVPARSGRRARADFRLQPPVAVDHPWQWAGIHGAFILGLSAAGIASWKLNESLLQAASDREEKLAEAQGVARIGSWEWQVETGRVTWSDELYRLFGVDDMDLTPSARASFPAFIGGSRRHRPRMCAARSRRAFRWPRLPRCPTRRLGSVGTRPGRGDVVDGWAPDRHGGHRAGHQ